MSKKSLPFEPGSTVTMKSIQIQKGKIRSLFLLYATSIQIESTFLSELAIKGNLIDSPKGGKIKLKVFKSKRVTLEPLLSPALHFWRSPHHKYEYLILKDKLFTVALYPLQKGIY